MGGNDTINGAAADDVISGDTGDDAINGGAGNDMIKVALGDGFDAVIGGAGTDTISELLYISRNTVRAHVQRVITKLGAHSKLEAVAVARRRGLL